MVLEQTIYESLFTHATIGIVLVNEEGNIVAVNPFALHQFGYTLSSELINKPVHTLIPTRFTAKHQQYTSAYMQQPTSRPMGIGRDLHAIRKDGTEFAVEISLSHCILNNKNYVLAFVNDITQRKDAENALKKLNEHLELTILERTETLSATVGKLNQQIQENKQKDNELRAALRKEKELNELKSRFVSMASHEFRTPLSAVLSSTYLLSKYTTTAEHSKREKHIQRIISSVNTLNDILNDLLSVSKIEEGKITVNATTFSIEKHIQALLNEVTVVQKEEQSITYQHSGNEQFYSDPTLLKHCFINLLSNAMKFSPANGIITINSHATNTSLSISITDDGIGISKEDIEHLYERFFRAQNAANVQGTGLGLHIVQKYVELLGGSITCNSEINKGTTFTILLPIFSS